MWICEPCCGFPLKWSVKVLAWISLILAIIVLMCQVLFFDWDLYRKDVAESFGASFNITAMEQSGDDEVKALVNGYYEANFYAWLVVGNIYLIVFLLLEVWLFRIIIKASHMDSAAACKHWLILRSISTGFYFAFSIICIATDFGFDWEASWMDYVHLFNLYQIWVVNKFRKQIDS